MKVTALLANHAEAVNNLLYTHGAGIDRAVVPPGAPGPFGVQLGIGIIVKVPWQATNHEHTLSVDLIDADGHPVEIPTSPDTVGPFRATMNFNVGRPPMLEVGEEQSVALAIGLPGLPFPKLGQYRFVVSVDDSPMDELPFKLQGQPGMVVGSGPSAIPNF
jgi:hypothetical protein